MRRPKLLFSLTLAVTLIALPSHDGLFAQSSQVVEQLKQSALRVAGECNYLGFINQVKNIKDALDTDILNTLRAAEDSKDAIDAIQSGLAMPVIDFASLALLGQIQGTSTKISESEKESVAYQLQQVCEVWREASEVAYMAGLVEAGSVGILESMQWLDGKLDQWSPPTTTHDDGLTKVFVETYLERTANTGADTLQAMMYSTLHKTLETSDSLLVQLSKIQEALDAALLELWIYPNADGNCSHGRSPEYSEAVERYVCSPASPAKSEQVRARIAYLDAQMRNIQLYIDAQSLDIESIALMAENYQRRQSQYANLNPIDF